MDGNGDRQMKTRWRRYTGVQKNGRNVVKFLVTHKQLLLTGVLLIMFVGLLFGVASRLQSPSSNTVPSGVTEISYSAFLDQLKAGNVQAATLQGETINGLLAVPLTQKHAPKVAPSATPSAPQNSADFAAWSRYVGAAYSTWPSMTTTASIDPARAVYTQQPAGGDTGLMPLLLSKNVIINTLPVMKPSIWMGLFWRFIPLLLLGVVLLLILAPKNTARASRPLDDRMNQLGKSRARRFERAGETPPTRAGSEKLTPSAKPLNGPTGKVLASLEPPVTFADVAGIDEVRLELEEIVQFLRSPERFDRLGAHIPRGALLVGPPGTGKTLLAKAVAGEAGVPFFSISASEFVEMFVGVGASRVRDLFNQARQSAPCVIFIDEIDAVGRKRSMRISGNDERDQTLNQLLVELDGFDGRQAVVVIAATNRLDILDKALLRPGRFDRHITVLHPDRVGREAILKVHTRSIPLHEEVSLERLSRLTAGMTGADLANLANEAALCAARQDLENITHDCFEEALVRVQLGALRRIVMSEKDRRITAYHEAGHALVAYHSPEADSVNRVTILPRGQSLGVTQFTAEEDRYNYSRETLMARIAVGLGGRVAEELTFGAERVTTGAENDLQVVTDLARRMVTRWGMSEQVGVLFADYESDGMSLNMRRSEVDDLPWRARSLVVDADGQLMLHGVDANNASDDVSTRQQMFAMGMPAMRNTNTSATMASLIDLEVQRILKEGYATACTLLSEHKDQLEKLADALMKHEQLNRKQFEALFQD
jgi:ATP-dependent metalloprotease FtsH